MSDLGSVSIMLAPVPAPAGFEDALDSIELVAPSGPSIPVIIHHLRQQGIS